MAELTQSLNQYSTIIEPLNEADFAASGLCEAFSCLFCDLTLEGEDNIINHINKAHKCKAQFSCTECDFQCDVRELFTLHVASHFSQLDNEVDNIDQEEDADLLHNVKHEELSDRDGDDTHEGSGTIITSNVIKEKTSLRKRKRQTLKPDDEQIENAKRKRKQVVKSCDKVSNSENSINKLKNKKQQISDAKKKFKTFQDLCEALEKDPEIIHDVPKRLFADQDFACIKCDFVGRRFIYFQEHFMGHTDHPRYSCLECKAMFVTEQRLRRHMKTVHVTTKNFSCEQCPYTAKSKELLRKHVQVMHLKERKPSQLVKFKTFEDLVTVLKQTPNTIMKVPPSSFQDQTKFPCFQCNYVAKKFIYFKEHFLGHTGITPYVCKHCNATFVTKQRFNRHIASVHAETRNFLCTMCAYTGKTSESLRKHMLSMHASEEEQRFLCQQCPAKFALYGLLLQHQISKHREQKKFVCDLCNFSTNYTQRMSQHIDKHLGLRYLCPICGYSCTSKYQLQRHLVAHNPERKLTCDQCSFTTNRPETLRCHYRVHTGERPYPCSLCDYHAKTKSSLRQHTKLKHNTDRPHACNQCSKMFKNQAHLRRHMHTHTDILYQCHLCSYRGPTPASYRRHMLLHDVTRRWNCDLCEKFFATEGELGHHKRKCHRDNVNTEMPQAHVVQDNSSVYHPKYSLHNMELAQAEQSLNNYFKPKDDEAHPNSLNYYHTGRTVVYQTQTVFQ